MTLSAVVMAHPKRSQMVSELVSLLDRPVEVVWDQINDRHDTGARAMAAFDPSCTHHLVIQDDVIPCRDLIAGAEQAIEATPGDEPISLYTGRVRPFPSEIERAARRSAAMGSSWITMRGIYWGPALIVPTASIDDMLAWYRESEVQNYDRRLSTWWAMQEVRCWYTRPSLVEHRGTLSLAGHPGTNRKAYEFLGEDRSALDIDWSGPVVDMPGTAAMDDARQAEADRARTHGRPPKVTIRA